MQQLQQDALQAAFQVFISRTALNTREEAEPQQPGQDNLINMSMQQVGLCLLCCAALEGLMFAG